MISDEGKGKRYVKGEAPAPQHLAPVIDILEALKMSLADVKKPARSTAGTPAAESEAKTKRARKVSGG